MLKSEWFFQVLHREMFLSIRKLGKECFSNGFTDIGNPANKRKRRP